MLAKTAIFYSLLFTMFLTGCSDSSVPSNTTVNEATSRSPGNLIVYKTESCGCCNGWVNHIKKAGFTVKAINTETLETIKREHGISPNIQSCHTAISERSGYVFEGHIPARIITRFLENPPEGAIGLTVPGMPVGSPGMEVGNKFQPYKVLVLNKAGELAVFASVDNPEDQ